MKQLSYAHQIHELAGLHSSNHNNESDGQQNQPAQKNNNNNNKKNLRLLGNVINCNKYWETKSTIKKLENVFEQENMPTYIS